MSGGKLISGINTWTVWCMKYGAYIAEWMKVEWADLDKKTKTKWPRIGAYIRGIIWLVFIYTDNRAEEISLEEKYL